MDALAGAATGKTQRGECYPDLIPEELDTPEFRATWQSWCDYRRQTKNPLPRMTAAAQLKNKLKPYGPDTAVRMIERSIEHGWRGLFELREEEDYGRQEKQSSNGMEHGGRGRGSTDNTYSADDSTARRL